jgi:hypothetical protein
VYFSGATDGAPVRCSSANGTSIARAIHRRELTRDQDTTISPDAAAAKNVAALLRVIVKEAFMDAKSLATGTVVGGTTVFITGLLLFALPPISDFYVYAMDAGSATGVSRESPLVWAALLGALSYGALVTLAIGRGTRPTGVAAGMRTGAIVGFLLWFTADFMLFAVSNVGTLTSTLVAPFLELVPGAFAGGTVAGALGRVGVAGTPTLPESHV